MSGGERTASARRAARADLAQRLRDDARFLEMMRKGEIPLRREDVRLVARRLVLAAWEVERMTDRPAPVWVGEHAA